MKLYISGPMTGLPDLNFPLFNDIALALRMGGWDVVNPAELCADLSGDWAACMRRDIAALTECDGIVLLPFWDRSRGATLEHQIAVALGMEVFTMCDILAKLPKHIPVGAAEPGCY
ncbi:MAG: DUF4406 domain-containing protein [Pigmentiphaga sp.]